MYVDWDIGKIKDAIDRIKYAESDPYMDGFVTWQCKRDLYQILWWAEDALQKCSTYHDEEEFVKQRNINKMWDTLKDE